VTTSFRRTGLVAAAFVLIVIGERASTQVPQFRGRADLVSVDVAVQQRGRPVTGLAAADFEIFDNGVPQKVSDLAFETLPIDVTVALDISESVTGAVLDQLRRSVKDLAQDLTTRDRLRLLTFNVRVSRLVDFGAPASSIDTAFNGIRPFGATAALDTLAVALTQPPIPERRQLVVVFTDGDDRSSVTTPEMLLEVARRTTPTIGLVFPSIRLRTGVETAPSEAEQSRSKFYTQLADETGGFLHVVDAGESLESVFRRMLTDFRRSYVLYFAPEGVRRAGTHTLDVRVKRTGVDVHARRAYTAQ
jgi:VWFA-related protein